MRELIEKLLQWNNSLIEVRWKEKNKKAQRNIKLLK